MNSYWATGLQLIPHGHGDHLYWSVVVRFLEWPNPVGGLRASTAQFAEPADALCYARLDAETAGTNFDFVDGLPPAAVVPVEHAATVLEAAEVHGWTVLDGLVST